MQRLHHSCSKRFWQHSHGLLSSKILFTVSWLHQLVYYGGEAEDRTNTAGKLVKATDPQTATVMASNYSVWVRDWRTAILSSSSFDRDVISVIISSPIVFFCLCFNSTYSQMQCVTTPNCGHAEIIILSITSLHPAIAFIRYYYRSYLFSYSFMQLFDIYPFAIRFSSHQANSNWAESEKGGIIRSWFPKLNLVIIVNTFFLNIPQTLILWFHCVHTPKKLRKTFTENWHCLLILKVPQCLSQTKLWLFTYCIVYVDL